MRFRMRAGFLSAAVAAALALAGCGGSAANSGSSAGGQLTHIVFASAAPSQNPLFENIEIGQELGYYKQAGIDAEFQYFGSNQAVMAALLSNRAQVGVCTQDFQITYVTQGNDRLTKCFYEYSYPMKWDFVVNPDAPIRSLSELKGKTLGLIGLGTADESVAHQWLQIAGVNPNDVKYQVVGNGTPAGVALQQKRVDAFLAWDTTLGAFDVAGIKYHVLPRPPKLPQVGGFYLQATDKWLKANRQLAVGFGQVVAKSTIFALENPRAAALLYIKMHPESVGQGISEDKALQDMMTTVGHRSPEWKPPAGTPLGQTSVTEWKNAINLQNAGSKVKDPTIFFTNEYISDVDKFDQNAIKEQAKNYKA